MPVTLAMAAIDRSISAHRITKVRPTAMMPVTETWVRMLPTLSSVANEGLASAKNAVRKISVRNGAMLRICERRIEAIPPARRAGVSGNGTVSPCAMNVSLRRLEQAVFADGFAGEFAHDLAALEHDDAIGERQHGLRLGREHDHRDAVLAQLPHDLNDVTLGADIHAAGRLAQHQQPWRMA